MLSDPNSLELAVHSVTKGMGDERQRLPEILHHLVRAVPDLYPLIGLLERETGRKLAP